MKVWITKYALTKGIFECEVEPCFNINPNMVAGRGLHEYFHGNDWHRTREAAVIRANEMRAVKIKSLQKSLAKLQAKVFT